MVKIQTVEPNGIAAQLGIQPGDELISINEKPVNDRLDYRYYIADENIELLIKRGDEQFLFEIEKDTDDNLGLEPEDMKLMSCGNNCVFCFVYQNPKGMRRSLYFKDEDYRYSFLYGHYVTMTTLRQADLNRIVEQHLSPLYISVHSTETETRKLLLGIKRDDHLLEKIRFLSEHGIELHAQIVLVPGINDGAIFDKTIHDLKAFFPAVRSVAVVPLGLTRHRDRLMKLRIHTRQELKDTIGYVDMLRTALRRELGDAFVYLADEFFIKADEPIPEASYYDEFYQIENGVGEFRAMIDEFEEALNQFPRQLPKPKRITWVTGRLAAGPLHRHIIKPLANIENLEIKLKPVENVFYGATIQISGLLVGQDIYDQLKGEDLGDAVLLPPRVLNDDELFLDDWTVPRLENELGVPCHVYKEPLSEMITIIEKFNQ